MTDRELADAAWAEATQTTDSYPRWVQKGKPASSHWAKMKALLDQIGVAPIPTPTPTPTPVPTPTGTLLWSAHHETADLSEWYAPSTGPTGNYGGGMYNSGVYSVGASHPPVTMGGQYVMRAEITTPSSPTSGVRAFRWKEPRENRDLTFQATFYIPTRYTITGQFWNLFQFKSRDTSGRIDPLWALYLDASGYLKAGWGWGGTVCAGPHSGDNVSGKWYTQTVKPMPVGTPFTLKARMYQSNAFDGHLTFYQDDVVILDFPNVRTSYVNPTYNSWGCSDEWAVCHYSDGLSPSPAVVYIDDAEIRLP